MVARRLIILGSTGSIGTSTIEVVEHLRSLGHEIEVAGLAAGRNVAELLQQAERVGARAVAIAEPGRANLPGGRPVFRGPDAALELVEAVAQPGDIVVGAMVGAAGLQPTVAAIERGCHIALANKETLVAAGAIVMPLARARGVHLLPVDSEHSAIFQCMQSGRGSDEVRRLVITASGGPFRTWPAERLREATVEEALAHPTWSMGRKVTIDSASMMNKALEMIEAFWLFDLPAERIEAIIHPQSIVHSFVEFVDGSTIAQLSPPDMKLPIQYAVTWPDRLDGSPRSIDWATFRRLDFEPVDETRFPAVALARRVMRAGGTAGAVFNAANEIAVEAYLDGRIAFGRISELVAETLDSIGSRPVSSLADVEAADATARAHVRDAIGSGVASRS